MPQSQEWDGLHRQPSLLAALVERTTSAGQQPAPNTHSNHLSMQEKDLKLTAAPGTRSVDVDD